MNESVELASHLRRSLGVGVDEDKVAIPACCYGQKAALPTLFSNDEGWLMLSALTKRMQDYLVPPQGKHSLCVIGSFLPLSYPFLLFLSL